MILSPWFWLGILLALLGAGGAGLHMGKKLERSDWQAKEVARKESQVEAERLATKLHREAELRQAAIDTELQKTRKERDALKDADRRRALAGELQLRVDGICPAPAPDSPPDTGQRNGGASEAGVLPRALTADLYAFADEADGVSDTLRACRQVAISDRKESL